MTGTGGGFVPKSDGTGTALQGVMHNFYFTTEVRYLFRYSGTPGSLAFLGDDDLWVFVNGKLKLDLGAPHEQMAGTATIGDAGDDLAAGKVYEIAVFHADRHPRDSNFQLTLSDFTWRRSVCEPN
jgi:fibro-slime domain-containing protein